MHNALSLLLSIFLIAPPPTTYARFIPTPPSPSPSRRSEQLSPTFLADKCTFTLFHKQVSSAAPSPPSSSSSNTVKTNYIQINTLVDHANSLTIDIAHLRPAASFNSYSKVSETRVFAVEGLLDGRNLTVRAQDGGDEVRFESGGVGWSSEGETSKGAEAWCVVDEWVGEISEGVGSRERKMECGFPCERIEIDDEEGGQDERWELR